MPALHTPPLRYAWVVPYAPEPAHLAAPVAPSAPMYKALCGEFRNADDLWPSREAPRRRRCRKCARHARAVRAALERGNR